MELKRRLGKLEAERGGGGEEEDLAGLLDQATGEASALRDAVASAASEAGRWRAEANRLEKEYGASALEERDAAMSEVTQLREENGYLRADLSALHHGMAAEEEALASGISGGFGGGRIGGGGDDGDGGSGVGGGGGGGDGTRGGTGPGSSGGSGGMSGWEGGSGEGGAGGVGGSGGGDEGGGDTANTPTPTWREWQSPARSAFGRSLAGTPHLIGSPSAHVESVSKKLLMSPSLHRRNSAPSSNEQSSTYSCNIGVSDFIL